MGKFPEAPWSNVGEAVIACGQSGDLDARHVIFEFSHLSLYACLTAIGNMLFASPTFTSPPPTLPITAISISALFFFSSAIIQDLLVVHLVL